VRNYRVYRHFFRRACGLTGLALVRILQSRSLEVFADGFLPVEKL
jgi:hypothetical protein